MSTPASNEVHVGKLHVTLEKATNLNCPGKTEGSVDPVVKMTLGKRTKKSAVKYAQNIQNMQYIPNIQNINIQI